MRKIRIVVATAIVAGAGLIPSQFAVSQTDAPAAVPARDPGVRGDAAAGAGGPIDGLTDSELAAFAVGQTDFAAIEAVREGLGPTMNLDSCGGCHAQPTLGGTSPSVNPQIAFATKLGAANFPPSFIRIDGPVREARFVRNADGSPDGGVHALFTLSGRSDAAGCVLPQPDFATQVANSNVIFRIPTPVFGAGMIEQISDGTILDNEAADIALKQPLGIRGRANIIVSGRTISGQANLNGNDGTVARFGWKAQNKSLLLFSGEAYNVEMGITNELFQSERDETVGCQFSRVPNDVVNTAATTPLDALIAIQRFALFQRFLAPPTPSVDTPGGADSIQKGFRQFKQVGCGLCHTPKLQTGRSTVAALRKIPAQLYSDLLLHDMGPGLADGVSQGQAGPSEFRTAPLWGLGKRIFFLHDGRTTNLLQAIGAHSSGNSEANGVVASFQALNETQKQDLLNFLRSL
jgi:CxxC motif-containing protein (DUF1111 family)